MCYFRYNPYQYNVKKLIKHPRYYLCFIHLHRGYGSFEALVIFLKKRELTMSSPRISVK